MYQNNWIAQRLNEEHHRDLLRQAENVRAAKNAQQQPAQPQRSLLMKLRAEMNELALRWQATPTPQTRKLQHQR
jgi:hypothetical protein